MWGCILYDIDLDHIELGDIYSYILTFFSHGKWLGTIDFNNINLDDDFFDEDFVPVRLMDVECKKR